MKKNITVYILCIILLTLCPMITLAHSGRTDSSGGHHDYKNKSGLGSYHYHHGMGAHLHPGGICPYSSSNSNSSANYTHPKDTITMTECPTTLDYNESANIQFYMYSYYNDFDYTITSSDPTILRINPDESVTAVGIGTADIIVKTSHAETKFSVTTKEVFVKKIKILTSLSRLQVGEKTKIVTSLYPVNVSNRELTYTSSNNKIATVTQDGLIEGISPGKTTITVTSSNNISESLDIDIYQVVPEKIDCEDSLDLIVGDSYDFNIKILPQNTNNKNFTVSCDNEDILQYSNSKLNASKEGNTILHIKTWNGIKRDIPVTINIIPIEKVELFDTTEYMFSNVVDKSSSIHFGKNIVPSNATYKDIEWHSSNDNVVSINNGEFKINGTGKVALTYTTHNNISETIEIIVINKNLAIFIFVLIFTIIGSPVIFVVKRKAKKAVNNSYKSVSTIESLDLTTASSVLPNKNVDFPLTTKDSGPLSFDDSE